MTCLFCQEITERNRLLLAAINNLVGPNAPDFFDMIENFHPQKSSWLQQAIMIAQQNIENKA